MRSVFQTPPRILMGPGRLAEVGAECARLGTHAFVVTGKHSARASGALDRLEASLKAAGIARTLHAKVEADPTSHAVIEAAAAARQAGADVIIGLGGGSALDAAKAVAVLVPAHPDAALEERDGCSRNAALPLLSIPTTAGSGSEVSRVCVITFPEHKIKRVLAGEGFLSSVALLDPELTLHMPPHITAATGMDALSHAVEAYLSREAAPQTDMLALSALRRLGRHLLPAAFDGNNLEVRSAMLLGQMEAALACSNAGAGLAHAMSRPLGVRFGVAHGLANAILLPAVMAFNIPACEERMADIARALGVSRGAHARDSAHEAVSFVRSLLKMSGLPASLAACKVMEESLSAMAEDAAENQSALLNARRADRKQILALYRSCL